MLLIRVVYIRQIDTRENDTRIVGKSCTGSDKDRAFNKGLTVQTSKVWLLKKFLLERSFAVILRVVHSPR